MAPGLTVLTRCYNGAAYLPRVFASVQRQTARDFEWLVVNDGSTDATPDLLRQYAGQVDFPMRVVTQENRGAHLALLAGAEQAQGELLVPLDVDDACVPETVAVLLEAWRGLTTDRRAVLAGVAVLCQDQHFRLVGTPYPQDGMEASAAELRYRHRVRGEK